MSNLIPSSVAIKLDGQDYIIRYRALAFIKYAAECGGDLLSDVQRIGGELVAASKLMIEGGPALAGLGAPIGTMRDVLWAGLVDAQPMLKRDDVARMFGFRDMEPIMNAITQALQLTMPELEAKPERPLPESPDLLPLKNGRDYGLSSESVPGSVPTISSS